jgi:Mg2+ and Co2+ transporter CorA
MSNVSFYSESASLTQSAQNKPHHQSRVSLQDFLDSNPRVFSELKNPTECFWLDLLQPDLVDLNLLDQIFKLHPLTFEDIQSHDPFEKCESFDSYLFYCLRPCDLSIPYSSSEPPSSPFFPDLYSKLYSMAPTLTQSNKASATSLGGQSQNQTRKHSIDYMVDPQSPWYMKNHIYILHFRSGLVTIHYTPLTFYDSVVRAIHRFPAEFHEPRWTSDKLMYFIMENMLLDIPHILSQLQTESDAIDDLILYLRFEDSRSLLQKMARARKRILYVQRLLQPKLDILNQFMDRYSQSVSMTGSPIMYFNDICIYPWTLSSFMTLREHIQFTYKMSQDLNEMLQHCHSSYYGLVNIDQIESSLKRDTLLKRLSAYAIILLPCGLFASFYGMNIPLPGTKDFSYDTITPCVASMVILLLITLGAYIFTKQNEYI